MTPTPEPTPYDDTQRALDQAIYRTLRNADVDFHSASVVPAVRMAVLDALAAHDAQVAEKAWDEGYTAGTGPYGRHRNPYARTEREDA